ncbi:unnamed protein product [Vitrella brassicaformis CCMP3155]|uniref:Cleavage/polyadenylation specificity factor A subunit N-terminal domain-containing protein n=1 Tax=Vitrella brassicaformis (strain CCMP3155) TaxID=1169540 RepID=A0A0G4FDX1_VITBC|nr:unnamed protein product [Vitrella brassicaformis CCMP3155]|eukprot:CEM11392.1 unnamed protein product [Vitrella brassicaformis CCMP3155]
MMHPIVLPVMPSYQHQASTGELVPFGVYGGGKVVPFVSVGGERGAFVVPPGRREVVGGGEAEFLSLSSTSMIRLEYVEELDIPQRNDGDAPGSSNVAPSSAVEHIAKWDLAKPIPQLKVPLGSPPRPCPPPLPEDVIDHTDTEEPPLPPQPDAPSAATETHPQPVLMGSPCGHMALSDPSVGMLAVAVPLADEEPVVAYHGPKTGLEDEDSEYVPESLRGSFNERLLLLQSDGGAGAGARVGLRRVTDRHEVRLYRLDGGLHAPCAWWKFGPLEKALSLSFLRIYGETLLAVGSAQLHTDQPEGHTTGQVYLLQLPNPSDDAMDVIPPHPPPPLAAGTEGASGVEQYGFRVYLKSSYKGPVSVLTRFEPVSGKAASGSYVMHAGWLIVQEVGERQLLGGVIHDGMTFITCCSIIKDFVLIGDLFKGLSFFNQCWFIVCADGTLVEVQPTGAVSVAYYKVEGIADWEALLRVACASEAELLRPRAPEARLAALHRLWTVDPNMGSTASLGLHISACVQGRRRNDGRGCQCCDDRGTSRKPHTEDQKGSGRWGRTDMAQEMQTKSRRLGVSMVLTLGVCVLHQLAEVGTPAHREVQYRLENTVAKWSVDDGLAVIRRGMQLIAGATLSQLGIIVEPAATIWTAHLSLRPEDMHKSDTPDSLWGMPVTDALPTGRVSLLQDVCHFSKTRIQDGLAVAHSPLPPLSRRALHGGFTRWISSM